jgi:molybdopterin converting factor small subunit
VAQVYPEAVKVSFYGGMRPIVGGKTLEIAVPEGSSVRRLLDEIIERYPPLAAMLLDEAGAIPRSIHVFVNGRGVAYLDDGFATTLSDSAAAGDQGISSSRSFDSGTTPSFQPRTW